MAAVTQVRILVTAFFFHPKLLNGGYNQRQSVLAAINLRACLSTKQGPNISIQLLVSELPRTGNGHHEAFKLRAHDNSIGEKIKTDASAGNRTRINCLEGSYADHYTTDASGAKTVQYCNP